MKREALEAMQAEYQKSKDTKEGGLHVLWNAIFAEWGMAGSTDLSESLDTAIAFAEDMAAYPSESYLSQYGPIPSLNFLTRKMAILGTLREPEFMFEADTPADEPIAAVLQHAFRPVVRGMQWQKVMRRISMTAMLTGTAVAKVGWASAYVYGEEAWSEKLTKDMRENLGDESELPYGPSTESSLPRIKDGFPVVRYVSPLDIFFQPGVRVEEDIRRIYHRTYRPLVDVLHDARYKKSARDLVYAKSLEDQFSDDMYRGYGNYDPCESLQVEVVECWDKSSRQFAVFVPGCEEALRDWTYFPLPIECPYHFFRPINHPEFVWGFPYALSILGQAKAMNVLRRILIDRIERDGKVINLWDSQIPEDVIDRMEDSPHGTNVRVDGLANMLADGRLPFTQVKCDSAQADLMRMMTLFENDQAWISGLSDETRNEMTSGGQTATAASIRSQQQGLTTEDLLYESECFQEEVAGDVAQIVLNKWDSEQLIKVVGPMPQAVFWVQIERERVQKEFNLRIVAGSTERQDKLTQRRQWLELLPRLGEIMQWVQAEQQGQAQGAPPGIINWQAILEHTLDLFDATLKHKVLNQLDTAGLIVRLAQYHQILPVNVSPELARQVQAMLGNADFGMRNAEGGDGNSGGTPALPFGNAGVSFEERNRVPGLMTPMGMSLAGDGAADIFGRATSEAMMN